MNRNDEELGTDPAHETSPLLTNPPAGDRPTTGGQHHRHQSEFSFFQRTDKRKALQQQHHRARSSLRHLVDQLETITEDFGVRARNLSEDLRSETFQVQQAFSEELDEADRGDMYFLNQSMTRGLSVLPEDLPELVSETTGVTVEQQEAATKDQPLRGPLVLLMGAVVAVSSNGTALSLWKGVAPPLKMYWRMSGASAGLFFFALRQIRKEGWPQLSTGQWITFGMAVCCYAMEVLLFAMALEYTAIGNAVIYANSRALLLLMGKALVGESVLLMEGAGALLAFSGALLCSKDSEKQDGFDHPHAIWGDLLALASALGGVGYLTFAKAIRPHMGVTVFIFAIMFCGSFFVLLYMLVAGFPLHFNNDPYVGLFGWIQWRPDRILVEMWLVLVCNFVGTMGFVRAMQYFDNIIIAVSTLMEPMLASFIATLLHVGVLPGPLGWLGNLLVVIGTLGVVYPSVDKGSAH